jgi:hypothetical protein
MMAALVHPSGPKVRSKILFEELGWDKDLAKKIWCFGSETTGRNMVVDMCKGVQYLNEIKNCCGCLSMGVKRRCFG